MFLVEQDQGEWLQVLLPVRPNGSTGWIRAADVTVASNPYSVDIALAEHRLVVRNGDTVVVDAGIGVGTAPTPTPGGKYYIKELLQPPDPGGAYGPYAYGLSGFSNVLDDFNGGDGVIGIHGTNEPEAIGTDVSHGCIRVDNDTITQMAASCRWARRSTSTPDRRAAGRPGRGPPAGAWQTLAVRRHPPTSAGPGGPSLAGGSAGEAGRPGTAAGRPRGPPRSRRVGAPRRRAP